MPGEYSPKALEAARRLFASDCEFVAGAATPDSIPSTRMPEIAFAGRSNAGKSSLLNALTGRKALARVSQTPGRTRQINLFRLGSRLMLADLPGYGFAHASKAQQASWSALVTGYLIGRPNLRRVVLLIDARRGIMPIDREAMTLLDDAAVSYQLVLTKCDTLNAPTLMSVIEKATAEAARHKAAHPELLATSAIEGDGIPELRASLASLATR
jgi:GTP-binding protein